jgi:predicted metal-dependent peptidase
MLSIGKLLTVEQRLSKALVAIMGSPKYTALAGVLMIGEKTVNDIPTACTNGRDEMYGREFVEGLTDAELRGLVLHENYHKLYQHMSTWKHLWEIDPNTANQAMDYVINIKIMDDNADGFAVIPKGGLIDAQYRDMDTAQVFNLLRQSNDGDGDSGGDSDSGGEMDEHDWKGAQDLSDEEKGALARDIDEAIRQGALAAGKMGGTDSRDLEALLKPQVDWREVLREFISTTCAGNDYSTWARPNRRLMSQGVYMPSGISQSVGELVVAIDTSGSINKRTLTAFLSEVKSICDTVHPEQVRLLYWGHEVVGDESYKTDELDGLITSTKPIGGGGTDVNCVTQYMTAEGINPQACIVLTDGYLCGNWGEWSCPVLWTVIDNKSAVPTTGTAIHIKSGDM